MPFVGFKPFPKVEICRHPEHDPPKLVLLEPGVHVYKCPACGKPQAWYEPRGINW